MFGFKTEEEKAKLADYDRLLAAYKDLLAHDKAMEENRDEWKRYAKQCEAHADSANELANVYKTEVDIRRKNDELRQKLTIAK